MIARGNGIEAHYQPEKKRRIATRFEMKKEESSAGESSASTSFPNGFLSSFTYKKESIDGVIVASTRRSLRNLQKLDYTEDSRDDAGEKSVMKPRKRQRGLKKEDLSETLEEEQSEYLPEVPDYVKENMDILIIGSNPGRMSSRKCQHFSHPSNHFYKALHQSGLTPTQIPPSMDYSMLDQVDPYFSIGLTNLVARPTRMAHELNKTEESIGTEILIELCRKYRPKVGIFIGIGVSRGFERSLTGIKGKSKAEDAGVKKEEEVVDANMVRIRVGIDVPLVTDKILGLGVGLMNVGIRHAIGDGYTLLFAMPSTSGRVTTHQLKEKAACMSWARIMALQLGKSFADQDASKEVSIRLI